MKKILLLVAPLLFASLLRAAAPVAGSYLTVTFALKATEGVPPVEKTTSTSYTATHTVKQVALNNTYILEKLRAKGVLGAGETSISGWKIVALYKYVDSWSDIIGFYALKTQKNGDIAVKINDYIHFQKSSDTSSGTSSAQPEGFIPAYKGRITSTSVSLNMRFLSSFYIDGIRSYTVGGKSADDDGKPYSECLLFGLREESMKLAMTKSRYEIVVTSSVKMTLYGQDDGWQFLEGKVTLGSPVALDDIYSVFPR